LLTSIGGWPLAIRSTLILSIRASQYFGIWLTLLNERFSLV
jgi:hypothetical protein